MFRPWLADADRHAFAHAVSHVESLSAVELVVVVRRRSRVWGHVPLIAGAIGAWATLAVMLYSAPIFALSSFLIEPFALGVVLGWAAGRVPWLIRLLTPRAARRTAVIAAANNVFLERGVHGTRGRTGVLVYCALAERMAAVVADTAVVTAVAPARLVAWRDQIEQALARGASPAADAIAAMAPVLAAALPRLPGDENELADDVDVELDRGSRP